MILGFSPKIFFILTSVNSETSWGQTMSFSDLTEVSKFSWRFQLSFEVYYISVRQKLVILGFSHKIFFILTSVNSETSWGQTMGFSDLSEVLNFSWRCKLLYGVLFVELGWKLKHPETANSQWALLDTPCLLNWPKSPHRLGLKKELLFVSIKIWSFLFCFVEALIYFVHRVCNEKNA